MYIKLNVNRDAYCLGTIVMAFMAQASTHTPHP